MRVHFSVDFSGLVFRLIIYFDIMFFEEIDGLFNDAVSFPLALLVPEFLVVIFALLKI